MRSRIGYTIILLAAAAVGCGESGPNPDAANLTYSEALQNLTEQQRELTRLLDERAKAVAAHDRQVEGTKSVDEPPSRLNLGLPPGGDAKLEDVRLDLGPAHAETLRRAEQAHSESLQRLDVLIARQRERVEEAKAIKDSVDN